MLHYASQRSFISILGHPTFDIYDVTLYLFSLLLLVEVFSSSFYFFVVHFCRYWGWKLCNITSFYYANVKGSSMLFLKKYVQYKRKLIKVDSAISFSFATNAEEIKILYFCQGSRWYKYCWFSDHTFTNKVLDN